MGVNNHQPDENSELVFIPAIVHRLSLTFVESIVRCWILRVNLFINIEYFLGGQPHDIKRIKLISFSTLLQSFLKNAVLGSFLQECMNFLERALLHYFE